VCGVADATSTEFEKPGTAFIDYLPDQNETIAKGGTLRLGHQEASYIGCFGTVILEGGYLR
jgi:CTP synthase (UTP-ammonia lyase)